MTIHAPTLHSQQVTVQNTVTTNKLCVGSTCIDEVQLKKVMGLINGTQHFELATNYPGGVHCAYGSGPNTAINNETIGCQGETIDWHKRLAVAPRVRAKFKKHPLNGLDGSQTALR